MSFLQINRLSANCRTFAGTLPRSFLTIFGITVAAAATVMMLSPSSSTGQAAKVITQDRSSGTSIRVPGSYIRRQEAPASIQQTPDKSKPLWTDVQYTEQDRDLAVDRGLRFIYGIASNSKYFSDQGHDLLFCFYTISNTAKNEKLREMARTMGQERARRWRIKHPNPPRHDPDDLYSFVMGTYAADRLLNDRHPALNRRVQRAAQRYSAVDFLLFNPRREPPPADIPDLCPHCDYQNSRGATVCRKCRTALTFRSCYEVWLDALVITYIGDVYGVKLGASYPDVLRWVSLMRPYPAPDNNEDRFDDVSYSITHLIYTLNNYNEYRLSPASLPDEFNYLKTNIREAERYSDGELLGEFLDSLRAFGEDETAPEIRDGVNYLLSHQNADGSWGEMDDDTYGRYHRTWTAIDGLRQYAYRGEVQRYSDIGKLLWGTSKPRTN